MSKETTVFCKSSIIKNFSYCESDRVLTLVLENQSYRYLDVPKSLFEDMKNTSSKGKFFNNFIKNVYKFEVVSAKKKRNGPKFVVGDQVMVTKGHLKNRLGKIIHVSTWYSTWYDGEQRSRKLYEVKFLGGHLQLGSLPNKGIANLFSYELEMKK